MPIRPSWSSVRAELLRAGTSPVRDQLPEQGGAAEGFTIRTLDGIRAAQTILVAGNDARGVLFGVGRLSADSRMAPGKVVLPDRSNGPRPRALSAPRASARLSPQDQLLRRLGPAAVGAVPSATWPSLAPTPSS